MTTPRKRFRSRGTLNPETGLIVLDGHVRLTDLALALNWPLQKATRRLTEHGITPKPRDGLPAGRWVPLSNARRFLADVQARRKARS